MAEFFNVISKFGMVGVPGIALVFIVYLLKLSPITLFTSTAVERKILSKEKKTIIVVGEYLTKVIAITVIYCGITFSFFEYKVIYNEAITIVFSIMSSLSLLFIMVYTHGFNKNIKDLLKNKSVILKIIIILFLAFTILIFFLILPYLFGSHSIPILEEAQLEKFNTNEIITLVISVMMIYFFASIIVIMPMMKIFNMFFGLSDRENDRIYFEEKIEGQIEVKKWFVYYSSNNKMVFVGNHYNSRRSNEFKFVPIEDIYKKVLKLEDSSD